MKYRHKKSQFSSVKGFVEQCLATSILPTEIPSTDPGVGTYSIGRKVWGNDSWDGQNCCRCLVPLRIDRDMERRYSKRVDFRSDSSFGRQSSRSGCSAASVAASLCISGDNLGILAVPIHTVTTFELQVLSGLPWTVQGYREWSPGGC